MIQLTKHHQRRGRTLDALALQPGELRTLREWARSGKTAQAVAQRARVVLACAEGLSNREVSRQLGLTPQTVGKWRTRFLQRRVPGLLDEQRPGAPRRIADATVEAIIARTLQERPARASRWSARAMAREMDLSGASVIRIWRAYGLNPGDTLLPGGMHRGSAARGGDRPADSLDVAGVFISGGIKAMVLCTRPGMGPAVAQADGTAMSELPPMERLEKLGSMEAAARRSGTQQWRSGAREFLSFLEQIDAITPADTLLHVIMNTSGQRSHALESWMRRHRRFHRYATPAHSAWTEQIERWFRLLAHRRSTAHEDVRDLEAAICSYLADRGQPPDEPFAWVKHMTG